MTNDFELQNLLRESIDSFFQDWRSQHRPTDIPGLLTPFDRDLWQHMAELGWLGLALPESLHGSGLGLQEAALLAQRCGHWLAPATCISAVLMPSIVLSGCTDNPLAADLAKGLVSGKQLLSIAWQEQRGQLDPTESLTTTLRDGQLTGCKLFVADVSEDSTLLVWAQGAAGEPLLVAVAASSEGVAIEALPAGQGNLTTVRFTGARVAEDAVLCRSEQASNAINAAVDAGRIALCAWLTGSANSCFEKTLAHLRDRQQFGKALGSFQALRHRCVDLHIQLQLANASWRHALQCHENSPASITDRAAISAAKARCADTALKVAKEAIQMHGAMGFVEEGGVGHYLRAALQGAAWLSNANRHRRRYMAAQLLDDGESELLDESFSADTAVNPDEDINQLPDKEFRLRFRAFLHAHYPQDLRQDSLRPFRRMNGAETRAWMSLVHRHGWRAPEWPREYGGLGLSFRKQRIYNEEMERIGVARMIDNGVTQLGPTLMKYGSEDQKRQHLPRILDCSDYWAQGYSEPNAGSDLASLKTRADRDGDHFIVNGQKIWTTLAMEATHCYALVRTGHFDKKQKGISFLLIDLTLPGVDIRPIRHIAGEEELCEVFFSDVKVPVENLVGPLDDGWTVAKALLGHERIWLASPNLAIKAMMLARQLVVETGSIEDQGVMDRLAQLLVDLHDYRQWYEAICQRVEANEEIGAEASALKITITELTQRITEFSVDIGDELGAITGPVEAGNTGTDLYWQLAMSRPGTIYAGCNEVQRDILAKTVLGLP